MPAVNIGFIRPLQAQRAQSDYSSISYQSPIEREHQKPWEPAQAAGIHPLPGSRCASSSAHRLLRSPNGGPFPHSGLARPRPSSAHPAGRPCPPACLGDLPPRPAAGPGLHPKCSGACVVPLRDSFHPIVMALTRKSRQSPWPAISKPALAWRTSQKIVFQRQRSDLGMEHRQVYRRPLTVTAALRSKYPSRTVGKLRLPLGDLIGVNVELLSQLGQRFLTLYSSQSHLRFESRCMVPAWPSCHCFSCAARILAAFRQKLHLSCCPDFQSQLCPCRARAFGQTWVPETVPMRVPSKFANLLVCSPSDRMMTAFSDKTPATKGSLSGTVNSRPSVRPKTNAMEET
jgi:hypothetical protein